MPLAPLEFLLEPLPHLLCHLDDVGSKGFRFGFAMRGMLRFRFRLGFFFCFSYRRRLLLDLLFRLLFNLLLWLCLLRLLFWA